MLFYRILLYIGSVSVIGTMIVFIGIPFFQEPNHRKYPTPICLPKENLTDYIFWIIDIPVSIGCVHIAASNLINNIMFCAVCISVNSQFKLLKRRILRIPEEIMAIKLENATNKEIEAYTVCLITDHIRYHVSIYSLVAM